MIKKKLCTFATANEKQEMLIVSNIGLWCNGNTTDSGPVISGSSPDSPTNSHYK